MERNAKKNEQFLIMDLKKRINDKKYKQYLISCTDPESRIVYNLVFDYMDISISPNRILLSQTGSKEYTAELQYILIKEVLYIEIGSKESYDIIKITCKNIENSADNQLFIIYAWK